MASADNVSLPAHEVERRSYCVVVGVVSLGSECFAFVVVHVVLDDVGTHSVPSDFVNRVKHFCE